MISSITTKQELNFESKEKLLAARDNINSYALNIRICAQALGSLTVNDMSQQVLDTVLGCEQQLNELQANLTKTENLLRTL